MALFYFLLLLSFCFFGRTPRRRVAGQAAFATNPDLPDLDEAEVDDIVNRVKAWYDVLPRQPMPTAS
jgi:hypothetical protein